MGSRPKILFLTNEEHGQASVHITLAYTLLERYGKQVDLHICSFSGVVSRCPEGATFHQLDGEGMWAWCAKNWAAKHPGVRPPTGHDASHRPTTLEVLRTAPTYNDQLFPWPDSEYIRIAHQATQVIEHLQPDLVLVDPLCGFGIDACAKAGARAITLSPVTWSICARVVADKVNQGRFLTWPGMASGNPYPLPWYLYPSNLLQVLFAVLSLLFSPCIRRLNAVRAQAGFTSPAGNPIMSVPQPVLCQGTLALDFAGVPTPSVLPFGPLIRSYPPLQDIDADLHRWLEAAGKGRTVLISLGSHFRFDEKDVRAMMAALEGLMVERQDVRVLWKLVPEQAHTGALDDLEKMVQNYEGRLQVVQWLNVDPAALLQSGWVRGYVHHGGGNSYHEALGTGVPQIVLAGWLDCYGFGQRVEDLGIGIWANRHEAPSIASSPIRSALLSILQPIGSPETSYALRAAEAALVSRDAASMPRHPVTGDTLETVKAAQAEHIAYAEGNKNGCPAGIVPEGNARTMSALVHGRDVMAEWVYEYASSKVNAWKFR